MRLDFADYVFDSDRRELRRRGEAVTLSPKAFQLLSILIENRPKAMSKAELYEKLWPKTFVEERNLASLVSEIRTAIGDDAKTPKHLRTVYGFGYAFEDASGPAASAPRAPSRFVLLWKDGMLALREGENIVGRDAGLDVTVDTPSVSRRHARIRISGDSATLEDLASKNGTFVRGARVEGVAELADGDEIRLGKTKLRFRDVRNDGSTVTEGSGLLL